MLNRRRFALNRIACPSLDLPAFFKLAVDLDLSKVELRNDLPGKLGAAGIIDGLKPSEAAKMAKDNGVSIIAINALQKFNLASVRKSALKKSAARRSSCARTTTRPMRAVPTSGMRKPWTR